MRGLHPQSHVTLRYCGHVTKNVISPPSKGLWTPNLAGWWLSMMGSHLQSHVTDQPRGHVTNQKRYISTFTRPTDPKLCRVVAQDEEISSTKSHDTSTTWSRDKSKNFISLLSQGLWTPNLAGWWLKMRVAHPQSHMRLRYRGQVTNQKRFISTFTRPMAPKTW